jgi:multidrug efflux system membrane fusion protein
VLLSIHFRWALWPPLCVLALATALAGCRPTNEFVPPPPPKVTVAQPVERAVADSIEFVGRTDATATVDLRSRVNGYLERILFEDGATVEAGELLFVIEQSPFRIALDAAKAELERAEATRKLAETELRRIEPLVPRQVVTQAELDQAQASLQTAQAGVMAAEAAVAQAELNLTYTEIRAPIDGHIGRHLVDIGNLVQAEQTQLAIIQAIDPIYAYFDLSETDLLRLMEMLRKHELPDPNVTPPVLHLGLSNEKGFPHEGRLDFRQLGVDPGTGTTMRRGIFPNADGSLIPGLFARIFAAIGQPVPRLVVEDRAIGTDQRGQYVLVVNDQNLVEYRPVQLGISSGALRVVEEGIGPNDWVIVNGIQRARPGITVSPERVSMQTDAAAEAKAMRAEEKALDADEVAKPPEDMEGPPLPAAAPQKSGE